MKPKILLTGFTPFSDFGENPTQKLMEMISERPDRFPDLVIRTAVLETEYEAGQERFREELEAFDPDGVISFGLNFKIDEIALERIAVNMDDAEVADNIGVLRSGEPIAGDGPVGYMTGLPIGKMKAALVEAGIPVKISNHAGAFLCNHVFYCGLHTIHRTGSRAVSGFVHIPPLPELLEASREAMEKKGVTIEGRTGMTMETIMRGARICINVLGKQLGEHKR